MSNFMSIIIHLEVININVRNFNFPIGFYSNPHPLWTPQNMTLTPFTTKLKTLGPTRNIYIVSITPPSFMKFCPVVPEICRGQVHVPKKERRIKRIIIIIIIIITRFDCVWMQTQKSQNDPHIRIRACGCKFHHYQPIPHFKILLDINFHWNRRPLTKWPS